MFYAWKLLRFWAMKNMFAMSEFTILWLNYYGQWKWTLHESFFTTILKRKIWNCTWVQHINRMFLLSYLFLCDIGRSSGFSHLTFVLLSDCISCFHQTVFTEISFISKNVNGSWETVPFRDSRFSDTIWIWNNEMNWNMFAFSMKYISRLSFW